jgi:hypothetical protein
LWNITYRLIVIREHLFSQLFNYWRFSLHTSGTDAGCITKVKINGTSSLGYFIFSKFIIMFLRHQWWRYSAQILMIHYTILFFLGEEYQINGQTSWCGDDFQWKDWPHCFPQKKNIRDGVLTTHKNVLDKVLSSCVKDNVSCSTYQDRLRKFVVAKTLSTLAAPLIKRSTVNKNKNVKNIIHQDHDFQEKQESTKRFSDRRTLCDNKNNQA